MIRSIAEKQEVRERYPDASVTIVHSQTHVLNPQSPKVDPNAGPFDYSNPPTALKLSKALEDDLKRLNIDLVAGDGVVIPSGPVSEPSAWDGSFGLQKGIKKVTLQSGKVLEADFVFVGGGNKPNTQLVASADPGAVAAGLVAVDKYLRVSGDSSCGEAWADTTPGRVQERQLDS